MASSLPSWLEFRPEPNGYVLVRPRRRLLSFEESPYLSAALFERVVEVGAHSVLLDLTDVEALSSDVIGALLHLSRRLRDGGGRLLLRNLGPVVRTVLAPFPDRQRTEPNRMAPFLMLDEDV